MGLDYIEIGGCNAKSLFLTETAGTPSCFSLFNFCLPIPSAFTLLGSSTSEQYISCTVNGYQVGEMELSHLLGYPLCTARKFSSEPRGHFYKLVQNHVVYYFYQSNELNVITPNRSGANGFGA